MRTADIKQAIKTAQADGQVTAKEIDTLMLQVRDEGGLDDLERSVLLKYADSFSDETK